MPRRSVTIPEELLKTAKQIAKKRGFASVNALLIEALEKEVNGAQPSFDQMESRIASTLDRLATEVRKANTTQQIHLAFTDGLARYLFQCMIEPMPDALEANRARAGVRYEKYLKSVTRNLQGDLRKVLKSLLNVSDSQATGAL
jgi:hypothetical protein